MQPSSPSKPITVLHVHGRMARGGAQMRTLEVFRHIDRRRYRFHFCALSGRQGELDEEIRDLGGQIHRMPQGPLALSRSFRELLARHRFDVVHCHLHHRCGFLLRLAARSGVPVRVIRFCTTRAPDVSPPMRKLARLLLSACVDRYATQLRQRRWIDRYATDILGVSRQVLRCAWGPQWHDDPRCRVVYDGLDLTAYRKRRDGRGVRREFGLPPNTPLLIHVGRAAKPKNHLRLISIFAESLKRLPSARLLLVGPTDAGRGNSTIAQLSRRIAELGIGERVILGGEPADVARLIQAADAMVFPSLWEGLPGAVLEACAAGTPVLASALPCIGEIAERLPGVHCLSLDEPDSTWGEKAAALIARPRSDADRHAALEACSRSVFDVHRCTATLTGIWLRGLNRANRRGDTVPPAAKDTVRPAAKDTVPPAAKDTVPPAAKDTVRPAARDTVRPAARDTVPWLGCELNSHASRYAAGSEGR